MAVIRIREAGQPRLRVRICGLCLDCWGLMTDRTSSLTGEWPGGWGTQRLGKMKDHRCYDMEDMWTECPKTRVKVGAPS